MKASKWWAFYRRAEKPALVMFASVCWTYPWLRLGSVLYDLVAKVSGDEGILALVLIGIVLSWVMVPIGIWLFVSWWSKLPAEAPPQFIQDRIKRKVQRNHDTSGGVSVVDGSDKDGGLTEV